MCVICVKEKGIRMPTVAEISDMWERNPHGAGFMYARNGKLFIEKGFMSLSDLLNALEDANISSSDPLILHFRISTQGGINKGMCHPFPIAKSMKKMIETSSSAKIGIAHNGVIARCTFSRSRYSDTAIFITHYVAYIMRNKGDIRNNALLDAIAALAPNNRFALMNGDGKISTIGTFATVDGLKYSNLYHVKNYSLWRKYGGNY